MVEPIEWLCAAFICAREGSLAPGLVEVEPSVVAGTGVFGAAVDDGAGVLEAGSSMSRGTADAEFGAMTEAVISNAANPPITALTVIRARRFVTLLLPCAGSRLRHEVKGTS